MSLLHNFRRLNETQTLFSGKAVFSAGVLLLPAVSSAGNNPVSFY
jgi:hypothetical protein